MAARPDLVQRNKERIWTQEMRKKVGDAFRGRKQPEWQAKKTGLAHRGLLYKTEIGYSGAHKRARAILPTFCNSCGTSGGLLEAALRHDAPEDTLREDKHGKTFSIAYPPELAYQRLCRSCHRQYDVQDLNI